jgi:hypothetical protein
LKSSRLEYLGGQVDRLAREFEWKLKAVTSMKRGQVKDGDGTELMTVPMFVPFESSQQAKSLMIRRLHDLKVSEKPSLIEKASDIHNVNKKSTGRKTVSTQQHPHPKPSTSTKQQNSTKKAKRPIIKKTHSSNDQPLTK